MNKFLPDLWSTLLLIVVGFLTITGVIAQIINNPDLSGWSWRQFVMLFIGICVYFAFSFLGFYYLIARIKKRGICWDDEGVYVDFSHHKIYWYEIEDIYRMNHPGIGRATVISTSLKHAQDIQMRLGKWKPAVSGYSFDIFWISVQQSKTMHEQLLHEFENHKKSNVSVYSNSFLT